MNQHETTPHPFYRLCRAFVRIAFKTYFRAHVLGIENVPPTGGVLIACNHQSFLDPPLVGQGIERACSFMARDSLFTPPLFGRLLRNINVFPVKRGVGDINAVKELMRRLKRGGAVVLFPEGTRSKDGSLGRINPNSLAIAKKTRVSIVPTAVDGTFEAWPPHQRLPRPRRVHVTYCEPISADEVRQWSIERIAEVVTNRLSEALRQRAT
jgi:1-acyl-sn-glycerol-3-phosphate acyltransferase